MSAKEICHVWSVADISLPDCLVWGRQAVMDGYPKEARNCRAGIIDLRAEISGVIVRLKRLEVPLLVFPSLSTDLICACAETR